MVVKHVNSDAEFMPILEEAEEKLVVVDFFATWCGPCHQIAPFFEQLSNKYPQAVFAKVDVDKCRSTSAGQGVTAMPTFMFYLNKSKVDMLRGGNPHELESKIKRLVESKNNHVKLNTSERTFLQRLTTCSEQVLLYEDELLQTLARSVIPVDKLQNDAAKKSGQPIDSAITRDFLILELLKWFKHEFFTWTDSPKCVSCGGKTKYESHLEPTPDEWSDDAQRVEGHKCETCGIVTRFPRYNNPGKLLETRTGRCGEWANCFTLCARSLGFEARYVIDWSDHVWTEVYSEHQKRWLHCDACENACDSPLMYEEGWGKKLNYVVAFSKDEISDVSYRYSKNHKDMTKRRTEIRENTLRSFVNSWNSTRLERFEQPRRRELETRYCRELVEFLFPRLSIKSDETQGRSSGSLDWRKDRGEAGSSTKFDSISIEPTLLEISAGEISISYSSFNDSYSRKHENQTLSGWKSCLYEFKNVFRKLEYDWKQVYLCRNENSNEEGRLVWMFKCPSDAEVVFESVELKLLTKTFESGRIRAILCAGDCCSMLKCDGSKEFVDLNGCNNFKIELILNGGDGKHAWQQSQVFRSEFDAQAPSFVINVKLKKK